jgi:hypothetical protein
VPSGTQILLRTVAQVSPVVEVERAYGPQIRITNSWQKLDITLRTTKSAAALNIGVIGQLNASACFLVDDVVLQRIE